MCAPVSDFADTALVATMGFPGGNGMSHRENSQAAATA
jgi:hypothetical protein